MCRFNSNSYIYFLTSHRHRIQMCTKKYSEPVYKQIFYGLYKYCIYWLLYIFTKFGSGITSVNTLIYGYSTLSRFTMILSLLLLHARYCPSVESCSIRCHNHGSQYRAIYGDISQYTARHYNNTQVAWLWKPTCCQNTGNKKTFCVNMTPDTGNVWLKTRSNRIPRFKPGTEEFMFRYGSYFSCLSPCSYKFGTS